MRSFIAVPRIILSDGNCSSTDKLIFGIINSLSFKKGYCYANNKYFENLLGLSTKTISNSLSNLKKLKYIDIEYLGRKRIVRLCKNITKDEFTKVEKNVKEDIEKNTTII